AVTLLHDRGRRSGFVRVLGIVRRARAPVADLRDSSRTESFTELFEIQARRRYVRVERIVNSIWKQWGRTSWLRFGQDRANASNAEILRPGRLLNEKVGCIHVPGDAPTRVPAFSRAQHAAIGISNACLV